MNCPVLSILDMREFDMNHTRLISLVSAIQFNIEKSKFKSDSLFVCSSRRCNRRNLVFLSPYNLKLNEFIQRNFPVLSLLGMREFYVDHTLNDSSVSVVQFTAEKYGFKWLATTDRKCFCSTT